MQYIDLKTQYKKIQEQIHSAFLSVLEHGQYIMGPEVFKLEQQLAKYAGAKHCMSCSSGTDALLMTLMAADVGPGDAVFTTPFTFIATAEVIGLLGATPVFVDIQEHTFNIDSKLLIKTIKKIVQKGELTPKAVIPVDIFGLPADYDRVEQIGEEYDLFVLEDAAQSFGGSINGNKTGTFGHAAATSFFPAKPLGCYGDGGAVFTDDDIIAEKLISIRNHGQGSTKYDNVRLGLNGRMDTIQAAILLEKLKIFKDELVKRHAVADQYKTLLSGLFTCQHVLDGYESAWAQFSLLARDIKERSFLMEKLEEVKVPTTIYYAKPLHLQQAFSNLDYNKGDFPVSESVSKRIFSLPMHPYLSVGDIDNICNVLVACRKVYFSDR